MLEKVEKGLGIIERLQKLGVPLSQIVLFSGLGVAYWYRPELVKQHWKLLVLLALLYEALVIMLIPLVKRALGFLGKVWEEHFEKEARQAFATWLRAAPGKYRRGSMRRYRQRVIIDHEVFNVRGMGLIAAHVLKLEQVFVDLKIAPASDTARFNPDPIAVKQFANARGVWDFVRASKDASGDAVALAIVGPPGCGKTTLLQHLAVTLAANRQRRFKAPAYTPLLLFLRDHAKTITERPAISLGEIVQGHFAGDRYSILNAPQGWFEKQLQAGKCLVLLDGLDEVAQIEKRRVMSQWVDEQLRRYPRCRFVITSRPQGYQDAPLQRANVVEAQPFNGEQVRRFVRNWYLANEVVSAGNKVDAGIKLRAGRDADDLLQRLANPKAAALSALTVNPLLLTMITMVHRYRGALPGSRVELYREICEVLLGRWRQAKGVQDGLTADQQRLVLMPLAARMMEREIREISTDDSLPIIRPPLRRVGVAGAAAKKFFHDLQAGSGMLLEREADRWSFAHLTFQEYLTAAYWLTEGNRPTDWQRLVDDSWWHETLRLYAAQGDATPILQACLTARNLAALTLAAEIMDEGAREIREDVRYKIEDLIETSIEAGDLKLRRLAAEVRLARRTSPTRSNSLHRLDDWREIDTRYITCAEYQLFLDEKREQGEYYQPDHWSEFQFSAGQGDSPICGVRAEDALAFCAWLTQRQGGAARYRLPTAEEARQQSPPSTDIGCWCQDDEMFNLSLAETRRQQIKGSLAQLAPCKPPVSPDSGALFDARFFESDFVQGAIGAEKFDFNSDLPSALDMDSYTKASPDSLIDRARKRISDVSFNFIQIPFPILDRVFGSLFGRIDSIIYRVFDPIIIRVFGPVPIRQRPSAILLILSVVGYFAVALRMAFTKGFTAALPILGLSFASIILIAFMAVSIRASASALTLSRAFARACDLDHGPARALAFAFTRVLDLDLARALNLDLAREFDRACACASDRILARELDGDPVLPGKKEIAQNAKQARTIVLFCDLQQIASARTFKEQKYSYMQSLIHLLAYAYMGRSVLRFDPAHGASLTMKLIRPIKWLMDWLLYNAPRGQIYQNSFANAYWHIRVVMSRAEGCLPAWEGIRIVREQISSETDRK